MKEPDIPILIERDSNRPVETIVFNRPEKRNALSYRALLILIAELERLEKDESVRILALRGVNHTFCSGLDLREATFGEPISGVELRPIPVDAIRQTPDDETIPRGKIMPRLVQEVLLRIKRIPQLTIGAAEGSACGGGAGILAASDYVLASEDFRAAFTEVKRGLCPALLFPFLTKKFPIAALQEAVFTARPFDAQRAKTTGLVQQIAPVDKFEKALEETIELFLANSQVAQQEAKSLFATLTTPTLEEVDRAWEKHWRSWNSPAGKEGVLAFLEKRG
ncbi:MAG: enoyl-CoA hydratase/isomerase family protein [Thermoguttaceae bacterium]|nr:enoyl-CoA hydratase/isomerase family protein [Thermoguttaceae bacterium]